MHAVRCTLYAVDVVQLTGHSVLPVCTSIKRPAFQFDNGLDSCTLYIQEQHNPSPSPSNPIQIP